MSKRLLLSFLSLLVSWGVYASDISVKNEQGVEIWYDFDADDKTASVTFKGNYFYSYSGWYSGDIVIPAMVVYGGEEYKVTSIGEDAFRGCSGLTSVTIGEGVTEIGDFAFSGCSGLTSVTIPDGVTSIGDYAFDSCSGLTSVTIPEGVTSIGIYTFRGCSGLTSVTIPENVTSIGGYAFDCCYKLYEVYNKSSLNIVVGSEENGDVAYYAKNVYTNESGESKLHTVGDYLFYAEGDDIVLLSYLGDETSITLPSDYEGKSYKIADYAFYNCSGLTSVTIPEGVTSIGDYAFYNCSGLTSVTIPESVTSIGDYAFSSCSNLTSIEVATDNKNYCSVDGVLFDKTKKTLIIYPAGKIDESYSIPNSVTSIGSCAFSGCSGLTSVTIGEGVTEIGDFAFSGCSGLTSVTIPNSVTSIGDYAFSSCSSLTSVTVLEGVTSIGEWTFSGCSGLTSVTIPNSVTSIGGSVFWDCSGLTSVTIGDGVTSIGNCAFQNCSSLTSVNYEGSIADWCGITFSGYRSNPLYYAEHLYIDGVEVKDLVIPKGVTSIPSYAFDGCSVLTSVTIPDGVTSIGGGAFEGCSGLTSVTIPEGVTEIGSSAFEGCSGLTSVTIPESVTSIGDRAFNWCYGLTSVTSLNTIPPRVGSDTFDYLDKSIPLYVPKQSVEAYKSAEYWKEFTNILAIDEEPNAISDIETDNISIRLIGNRLIVENTDDYAVYALSGQCLGKAESLERGVYIVVADGVSKKIVVK